MRREYAVAAAPYSIRLDDDLRKALEREAEIEDRPPSQLAIRAIRAMLDAKAAKRAALESALAEADKGLFVTSKAVSDWMDSWDSEQELPPPLPSRS